MTTPKRVQMSRQHPWRAQNPDAVIVARPSKWGNPYKIVVAKGMVMVERGGKQVGVGTHASLANIEARREEAVIMFRRALTGHTPANASRVHPSELLDDPWLIKDVRRELAGKDLACWCGLDESCHADVLLEIANAVTP